MNLREFLLKKTNVKELCIIREDGYIIASCWIDYEDLFYIPHKLSDKVVKSDEWDYLSIVNENNTEMVSWFSHMMHPSMDALPPS